MANQIHYFSFPTDIFFGAQSRKRLTSILHEQNCTRPLLVTDKNLAKLPLTDEICQDLSQSPHSLDLAIFSDIWGNPVRNQVLKGVNAYRSHQVDAVIALGGGAAMDVAKAISLMIHHPGDIFDYEEGNPQGLPINQPIPFIIALPTTAGTGSEVGRSAVISDEKTKIKKIIFSATLLPKKILADPELTLNLPADITAATGMDALTHLIEAYLSPTFHPLCDGIAVEGIKLVAQSLRNCVLNGKDIAGRSSMLMASMMGAIAFQKGLGVTHSCAHALATVCDLHHGLANGILLPYCLSFNADCSPEKFSVMAKQWGLNSHRAEDFIASIVKLKTEIGIPDKLSALGVCQNDLDRLVDIAQKDPCHHLNPKAVSKKDFQNIFFEAIG